ncbi:PWI domain-containing protein [Linderina pennispora]|uniref:PWI domain-containing protein n=1 Tax=Linderina pennispora TaxID=61395 RepID=A0A1Y1WGB0_9FUNG|nr:PWI domain-containing protein [Linderina pennispora]ORX72378.1 PWI domain-containing protein [Linderina pennispora]
MAGGFFRGTNIDQDLRFGDASKKLMKDMGFSDLLKRKVDMSKVNMDVIKPWIATTVNELLGVEDEVLFEYVVNLLGESNSPDPKAIQVNLTGFLESKTQGFMQDLWSLLLEAQDCTGGIPESLVKQKMDQLQKKREMEAKILGALAGAVAGVARSRTAVILASDTGEAGVAAMAGIEV